MRTWPNEDELGSGMSFRVWRTAHTQTVHFLRYSLVPDVCCNKPKMVSSVTQSPISQHALLTGREVCRAAIESVSPRQLVWGSVSVVERVGSTVMNVGGREYPLDHNVKVVAFGKAVLGMVEALESLLGQHIVAGVASVPKGVMGGVQQRDTLSSFPKKVKIFEGAANNLPDYQALCAAREILALCRGAGEGEVVIALISGGGSALLPCPLEGVELEDKRMVIEALSKAGADINELNSFRKFFSQTKGGRLAEATYPAQMVALVLSDVIGDPLDIIASGPTVPSSTTKDDVIALMDKYSLSQSIPPSIQSILSAREVTTNPASKLSSSVSVLIKNGGYEHVHNVILGSNSVATAAAADKAHSMGYTSIVWSNAVQGEVHLLGEAYAILAHNISIHNRLFLSRLRQESCFIKLVKKNPIMLREFEQLEALLGNIDSESSCNLCLISGGEPTVTVTGAGKGGRNQELALAFSLKYNQLNQAAVEKRKLMMDCLLLCLGTDGQDGPTDAAGAVGHASLVTTATVHGINGEEFLRHNDSYSFFSQIEGGNYLLKTGLTGTNVMDVHCILLTSK